MYIDSFYPGAGSASLEISIAGNGSTACLQFWYHMYGVTMGSLTVFSGNAIVFKASGDHGNHWIKATRNIYLDNTVSNDFINTVTCAHAVKKFNKTIVSKLKSSKHYLSASLSVE